MRIVLYICIIILNAFVLFLLPQLIKKNTYVVSLAISFGVLMILIPASLYVAKVLTTNTELQKIEMATVTSGNNELYDSVREIMAQKNTAVADQMIYYANRSLGTGKHTATEVASRIEEIMTGKVTVTEPLTTPPQKEQWISKDISDFIFGLWVSLMIVVTISLFILLAHRMVDVVIGFHTTYNAANLSRQPIKALVENRDILKTSITCIFFLGSFLMFYGAIFKMKI